jgi:hypothetical protein
MKPNPAFFWRWRLQILLMTPQPAFVSITDDDIASQVILQIPDDRH